MINGSNFLNRSDSFNPDIKLVARACSNFMVLGVIVIIRMLERIILVITLASLCLLAVLLNVATPTGIGPFGILAVFAFAYLSLLGVMTFFISSTSRIISHLSSAFTVRKPINTLSFRSSYYYSTVVAAAPIMLVGLQSVGAIGPYELLLVVAFVVIGCVYITKRTH